MGHNEKPEQEQDLADAVLRKMPSAFPPATVEKQEAYVERMIRRDREALDSKESDADRINRGDVAPQP